MCCRGKIATVFGVLGFVCVLLVGFSQTYDDSINSPLVKLVATVFNFGENLQKTEIVIKSVGFFDIF